MAEAGLEESLWRVVNELVLCGLQPACWILWGFKLHEVLAMGATLTYLEP